ncbi:MAG: hypothetical protein HY744_01235 [Deltaproteobacteria bacterium]|nr:hypothetical protein [Deltaproteobacteria bacterium]
MQCLGGSTKCGAKCVDAKADPANCGACNVACPGGQVCAAGACGVQCLGGSTKCGSSCVDVKTDPANCGACNVACPGGQVCAAGACGVQCLGGSTKCGSSCVDTKTDPANCGSCGAACAQGLSCLNGACTLQCAGGSTKCGSSCVDLNNDPKNCGGCGSACAQNAVCVAGKCTALVAPKGFLINQRNGSTVWQWDPLTNGKKIYHQTLANDADCNLAEGSSFGWIGEHNSDYIARFKPGSGSGYDQKYTVPYAYPKHITVFKTEIVVMHRNNATIYRYNESGGALGNIPTGNGTGQGLATDGTSLYASFWNGAASYFQRYNASYVFQQSFNNPSGLPGNNIFDFAYDQASGHFFGLVTSGEGGTGTESSTVVEFTMGGSVLKTYSPGIAADGIGQNGCQ